MITSDNKNININLHSLTGRFNDYVSSVLNVGSRPSKSASHDVSKVRKLLLLDRVDTDYFVIAPYMALLSTPSITRLLPKSASTILPAHRNDLEVVNIVGAKPVRDEYGNPNFEYVPDVFPVPHRWQVDYHSPTTVRLTDDTGVSNITESRFSGDTLYVTWPPHTGFRGGLKIDNGVWGADIYVIIKTPPRSYPYGEVVKLIRDNESAVLLMSRNGMLEAFSSAREVHQSVAALVASVILEVNK